MQYESVWEMYELVCGTKMEFFFVEHKGGGPNAPETRAEQKKIILERICKRFMDQIVSMCAPGRGHHVLG